MTAVEIHAANRLRAWAIDHVKALFANHTLDALVGPTVGQLPPPLSDAAANGGESNTALTVQLCKYVFLANLLGLPAVSLPLPPQNKLPVGFMMTGDHWQEAKLLRLSSLLADALATTRPRPKHYHTALDALLSRSAT